MGIMARNTFSTLRKASNYLLQNQRKYCGAATLEPEKESTSETASSSDTVLVETLDNIRLIGINRPEKRNAVDHATALKLHQAFQDFNSDPNVDAAVLYGEGGSFCAGYDLEIVAGSTPCEYAHSIDPEQTPPDFRPMGPTMMKLNKVVIGAIEGYAVGGGLELALMCDLRVVEESSRFGVLSRRFGVPLMDGGTIRLPKIIGLSRAMEMILTGKEINAKTALSWGLANQLVPTGAAIGEALDLARKITRHPKLCTFSDRNSVYHAAFEAESREDAFEYEFSKGMEVLSESITGAVQFASGQGRHGEDNVEEQNS